MTAMTITAAECLVVRLVVWPLSVCAAASASRASCPVLLRGSLIQHVRDYDERLIEKLPQRIGRQRTVQVEVPDGLQRPSSGGQVPPIQPRR